MSEEQRTDVSPEETEAEGPEPQDDATTTETEAPEATVDEDVLESDDEASRWREAKKKADREAKNLRERLKKYEAEEEKRRKAAMSDLERLNSEKAEADEAKTAAEERAEKAEARLRETLVRSEATTRAISAGAKPERIDAVLRLTDLSEATTEDGEPDGGAIEKALKATLKAYPEFRKAGQSIGDGSNPGTPPPDAAKTPWEMTPEQFQEIQKRVSWGERVVPT